MPISPTTVKFLVMGFLCMGWLAFCRNVMRLDSMQPFHVAAYHRDRRKARFYFFSVWVGLGAAILSFLCLEALAGVIFDTTATRNWILGVARGVGMWGLLITA